MVTVTDRIRGRGTFDPTCLLVLTPGLIRWFVSAGSPISCALYPADYEWAHAHTVRIARVRGRRPKWQRIAVVGVQWPRFPKLADHAVRIIATDPATTAHTARRTARRARTCGARNLLPTKSCGQNAGGRMGCMHGLHGAAVPFSEWYCQFSKRGALTEGTTLDEAECGAHGL